ncbi:4-hydroxyproline 2-epimerase [Trichinella pseudospiralis]
MFWCTLHALLVVGWFNRRLYHQNRRSEYSNQLLHQHTQTMRDATQVIDGLKFSCTTVQMSCAELDVRDGIGRISVSPCSDGRSRRSIYNLSRTPAGPGSPWRHEDVFIMICHGWMSRHCQCLVGDGVLSQSEKLHVARSMPGWESTVYFGPSLIDEEHLPTSLEEKLHGLCPRKKSSTV